MWFILVIVTFLGQFCPMEKGTLKLTLCEAPTSETTPNHNIGNYVPYSYQRMNQVIQMVFVCVGGWWGGLHVTLYSL